MGVLRWADAVDIGHGRGRLAGDAAASLRRVDDAFGRPADINEAWRSPEDADANYAAYLRFLAGGPWAPIALPGDQSVHCMGYALDTDDTADWQMAIWNDHGWYWTVYRNGRLAERWHLEYFRNRDNHRDEGSPAATDKPKEWDEMASKDEVKQAAKEGMVEALKDSTNLLAEVVKNELNWKMYGDLSVVPIAELNNAKHLCAFSTQRMIHVQQQAHVDLIVRAVENRGEDIMSSSEMDIVKGYCRAVYPPEALKVDVDALSLALSRISATQPGVKAAVKAAFDAHTMSAASAQAPTS